MPNAAPPGKGLISGYFVNDWCKPRVDRSDKELIEEMLPMIERGAALRGRVLSIFGLAFRGGGPVGSLVAGFLVRGAGAPAVMAAYAAILAAIATVLLLRKTELRHT